MRRNRVFPIRETVILYSLYVLPGISQEFLGQAHEPPTNQVLLSSVLFHVSFLLLVLYLMELGSATYGTRFPSRTGSRVITGLIHTAGIFLSLGVVALIFSAIPFSTNRTVLPFENRSGDQTAIVGIALYLSIVAATEETFFRAYLIPQIKRMGAPPSIAVIVAAAGFAAGHIYQGPGGTVFAFLAAVVLGVYWLRYPCLVCFAAAHAAYNTISFLLSTP